MLLGKCESDLYYLKWARFRTFSNFRYVSELLSETREAFLGCERQGNSTPVRQWSPIPLSGVPAGSTGPSLSESCLIQAFTGNLVPSRNQRPSPSCILLKCCRTQHMASSRSPTQRDRNIHSHDTLFPTSCHVPSTHQKQSHFIQAFISRLHSPSLL